MDQHESIGILAAAAHLPEQRVTTESDFEQVASYFKNAVPGLRPQYIEDASGVVARRKAPTDTLPSDLATISTKSALNKAGVLAKEVGLLLFAGAYRDATEPSTSAFVAQKVGLPKRAIHFDVGNACQGFVNAMMVAKLALMSGNVRYAVICTGELGTELAGIATDYLLHQQPSKDLLRSHFVNYTLGDCGGAIVLGVSRDESLVLGETKYISDPTYASACIVKNSSTTPMSADTVLLHTKLESMVEDLYFDVLESAGLRDPDIDFWVIHQPSRRSVEIYQSLFRIKKHAITPVYREYGNLITGSVPVQLAIHWESFKIGSNVLLGIQGGGISVSGTTATWR